MQVFSVLINVNVRTVEIIITDVLLIKNNVYRKIK